jgi:hypothetical protein
MSSYLLTLSISAGRRAAALVDAVGEIRTVPSGIRSVEANLESREGVRRHRAVLRDATYGMEESSRSYVLHHRWRRRAAWWQPDRAAGRWPRALLRRQQRRGLEAAAAFGREFSFFFLNEPMICWSMTWTIFPHQLRLGPAGPFILVLLYE